MAVSASLPAYLSEKLDAGTEYGTRKANTDIAAYASFDEEARIQRIANHVSAELLEMALNKIPVQMILIRQRMEQRQKETAARDRDRRARMAPSTASLRQHLSQNI